MIREKIIPEQETGRKFLFDSTSEQEGEENINDLQKKVRVLETLVKEYNALTAKEKTSVQTVHDYLVRLYKLIYRYLLFVNISLKTMIKFYVNNNQEIIL